MNSHIKNVVRKATDSVSDLLADSTLDEKQREAVELIEHGFHALSHELSFRRSEPQVIEFVAKAEDLEREINTALAGVADNLARSFGAIAERLLAVVEKDHKA